MIMNYWEFKNKWLGEWYKENEELWYQCVAGAKKYLEEVHEIKNLYFWGSALSGWNNWVLDQYFTKIENTFTFVPQRGDIIFFWASAQNGYNGHVGMVDDWNIAWVNVLNQNMGSGTGKYNSDKFKVSTFNYVYPECLWVYRPTEKQEEYAWTYREIAWPSVIDNPEQLIKTIREGSYDEAVGAIEIIVDRRKKD